MISRKLSFESSPFPRIFPIHWWRIIVADRLLVHHGGVRFCDGRGLISFDWLMMHERRLSTHIPVGVVEREMGDVGIG